MKLIVCILVLVFLSLTCHNSCLSQESIDYKKAEYLYVAQCSKCHRKDGSGIKKVYPPLKQADYIGKNDNIELFRGMLYGRSGKIIVNGVTYNGVMTTEIDKSLTDNDIILILTHVLHKLNGINRIPTLKELKEARKAGILPVHKLK